MMLRMVIFLLVFAWPPLIHAGPREDAHAAFEKFFSSFTVGNGEAVASLFAPDALFYGASSRDLVTRHEGVRDYFNRALSGNAIVKASLLTSAPMVLSDNAVLISGTWQVERELDGKISVNGPLRITVVLSKRGERWMIVQFHNSPRPVPPPAAQGK